MLTRFVPSARAIQIHRDAIVIDGHYDRLYDTLELAREDLPKLRAGGVTAHIRQSFLGDVLQFFERTHQAAETWPNEMCVATKAADILLAKREGKIATILSIDPLHGRV